MMLKTLSVSLILLLVIPVARAQPPGGSLERHMFPPELVMHNQQELGLSDDQRTAIKKEMQQGQRRFLDLRWELDKEMEAMKKLVSQDKVDEKKALTQLNKIMDIEKQIKRTQMTLLIRTKNLLTPGQRARLNEIKLKDRGRPRPFGGHQPMGERKFPRGEPRLDR